MEENKRHLDLLRQLLQRPDNRECADCVGGGTAARPSWASINTGTFICMRCAGIHRGLGVHISKVCAAAGVPCPRAATWLNNLKCHLSACIAHMLSEEQLPAEITSVSGMLCMSSAKTIICMRCAGIHCGLGAQISQLEIACWVACASGAARLPAATMRLGSSPAARSAGRACRSTWVLSFLWEEPQR